ncbi:DNA-binding LytR/AlgR family response regulator [Parabacteroides sp. PF5-5]|uniref:LytR/AlgR family response regulator transcription factor n=1 Tax=unclassified Parabacteroides TaxID=2649774 RepID=UPI0024736B56|nr:MULTISPECIES: LytTR family DNA-binding domain-containing protein [unclassified Parabacteroides]MDH6306382.1 DNA-binding LytR/AlgR family response regulator [Parabacteroides sp. PH5-39]MDH6314654.1 DNA-binding LytR/AlgR family response regulator [Parabacteroides sp. PF5-13]MDH6321093.1 DNA-binding LytR/AlgR family response regulator [Parabacteroides sp. PH5-13]MDH6324825.1 DNA-binding LytR/AlgR family response regulator [Parabacteroides sp. PH5-8]MDH6325494.1 DNA-binding LytR/AlgR family res
MTNIVSKQTEESLLRCLIVDDESVAIKGIVNYIQRIDFLEVADTCTSALQAASILKKKEIDLMFLDINMPHLSGLDFLESLEKAPLTIITTAYSEYALEGYRLNVVDYLLKPFSFQRFFQAVTKAQEVFKSTISIKQDEKSATSDLYVRQADAFRKISREDILYVEGMQNYLKLYLKGEVIVIHQTMISLEEMLPKNMFFRIHRSFLVNLSHIDTISGGRIIIAGKELPLASARKDELLKTVVYKKLISK